MADQIYIGNFAKGLQTVPSPFSIDNDAFPTMLNFYSWRGQAKRKRGTSFVGRLQRQVESVLTATPPLAWQEGQIDLVAGEANLLVFLGLVPTPNVITAPGITQATFAVVTIAGHTFTTGQVVNIINVSGMTQINGGYYSIRSVGINTITLNLDTTGFSAYTAGGNVYLSGGPSITPGTINFVLGANTYKDTTPNGILVGTPGGSGTINYSTGTITIAAGGAGPLVGKFSYFPDLPVLGLEDFVSNTENSQFPLLIAFDPVYAYQINQSGTPFFYSVSYYKGTNNPVVWSADDSNQFWSTNYQSAFWVTNNKPGFHFKSLTNTLAANQSVIRVSATQVTVGLTDHGLIVGDILWFNEVTGTISPTVPPAAANTNINGQTGIVTVVVDADTLTVDFTGTGGTTLSNFAALSTGTGGIAQYLTSNIAGQDGIRWYDGDPTNGTGLPTGSGFGWVNFAPPLTPLTVSINNQASEKYYLVGALAILPFKDRLLFFGPQIQAVGRPVIQKQIQDTVIWSWNGTAYYSSLVPTSGTARQTSDPSAYYVRQTGKGGYLSAGISQPILTVNNNEDVILIGFGGAGKKTRFVYTGNDLQPFLFYLINSELPSSSTFGSVTVDKGGIDVGTYGITITTQQSTDRIDLDIPDEVFKIQALNNGQKRVNAIRDFYREWIYFSYPIGDGKETNGSWVYPVQSFLFNYVDNTWAIFRENFTHHGTFRRTTGYTWGSLPFKSWETWKEPWDAGTTVTLFPDIVAGNPQGYVLIKGEGTGEAPSGSISAILNDGFGFTQITSVNHCVNIGDYLYFLSSIGITSINAQIALVTKTIDADNFVIDLPTPSGTYLGLGTYTRLSRPLLQTKQFPVYWNQGRKVRLCAQKYLLDYTNNGQVTVNINLSQDPDNVYNLDPVVPANNVTNSALIYSQLLYTCPESTNIGLSPANTNLQMPTAQGSYQIWHRINTSLIGDSVQIGITLSDTQMRNISLATQEIALQGLQLTVTPGPLLA